MKRFEISIDTKRDIIKAYSFNEMMTLLGFREGQDTLMIDCSCCQMPSVVYYQKEDDFDDELLSIASADLEFESEKLIAIRLDEAIGYNPLSRKFNELKYEDFKLDIPVIKRNGWMLGSYISLLAGFWVIRSIEIKSETQIKQHRINPHSYPIENIFSYHAPKNDQVERYGELRERAKEFAQYILDHTPESKEKSIALRKLEECVMWSNASIARNE